MAKLYYQKRQKKLRKRLLKGYELQRILYRTAVPLSGLFAGIAGALLWLAVAATTGPLRSGLLVIAGLFTAAAALLLAKAVFARRFLNAYRGITELRQMDPFQFEHYIANLFRRLGYAAKVTARSVDIGVDVLLKKDGKRAVVQCKRYGAEKCVGSPEIQQFVGSMQIYGVTQGFFVATTRFSLPAAKLASGYGIQLIDDAELALLIRKAFRRK